MACAVKQLTNQSGEIRSRVSQLSRSLTDQLFSQSVCAYTRSRKYAHVGLQFLFFLNIFLYTLLSQWEFLPWEIRVAFPKESQLQQSRATQSQINYKVHAGSFCVSVIHRTLTRTTGSLTCVRDHSCACVVLYTRGLGTPTASQHDIYDLEKLTICS